jgi:hypothetical protein
VIGTVLKHTAIVKDNYIPIVLLAFSIAFCIGLSDTTEGLSAVINGGIQGVLTTGAAVLGNQVWKQNLRDKFTNKEEDNEEDKEASDE